MGLNSWQMLLWIAGLELISVPLIIFMANAIVIGYFKTKQNFIATTVRSFGKVLEDTGKGLLNKNSEGDKE